MFLFGLCLGCCLGLGRCLCGVCVGVWVLVGVSVLVLV